MKRSQKLFMALILSGVILRLCVAVMIPTRVWIDEIWVVLDPAYRMLTGIGPVERDWTWQVRDHIPPSMVYVLLKILHALGITGGILVQAIVRGVISLAGSAGLIAFILMLERVFKLKSRAWFAALVAFFIPEIIHYSGTAELSVIGLPFLLAGLALVYWQPAARPALRERCGFILLSFSALIRFQFGIFPAVILAAMLLRREYRHAVELALTGIAMLLLDFAFNSWMYGNPVLPIYNYFMVNTTGGVASSYGVTPFYFAFELLWRFSTEVVFATALFTSVVAFKKTPAIAIAAWLFFIIHAIVPHKEYRFFYGSVVTLGILGAVALQTFSETQSGGLARKLLYGAAFAFILVAGFRAVKKVDWFAYTIPAALEMKAGQQQGVRGLITYGWGGIYQGCNYVFHQPLPCVFAEKREHLAGKMINPNDYSHIVASSAEPAPCLNLVSSYRGGSLYACSPSEIAKVIRP